MSIKENKKVFHHSNETIIADQFKCDNLKTTNTIDHGLQCWLVVFSCSMINFILFGIYRSYALLFTALLNEFHISRTDASLPFSLCMTLIHLTGPISGLLTSLFTIRTVYACGCLLSTLGIGLCYFATSISDMALYIGCIQGIGIGLTYVQSIAILSEYFNEKLGMANGLTQSAGPLGPFILTPLLSYTLKNYKLKGSFIVLTLVTMLTIPLTIILKHNLPNKPKKQSSSLGCLTKFNFKNLKSYNLSLKNNSDIIPNQQNSVSLKCFKTLNELDTQQTFNSLEEQMKMDNEKLTTIKIKNLFEDQLNCSTIDKSIKNDADMDNKNLKKNNNTIFIIDYNQTMTILNNQIKNQDHQVTAKIEKKNNNNNFFSILKKQLSRLKSSSKRLNSIKFNKPNLKLIKQDSLNSTASNSMFSFTVNNLFSIISSIYFLLIMYTHLAYFWTIITFQMVIVDFSNDCNIPSYLSNNMITSFSLGDLIGRLSAGYILDRKFCANKNYFIVCNLFVGILMNLLNFVNGYYGLLLITLCLGILAGTIVIVINICLLEYLGKKVAALAFGISCFICGIATLARPFLIGWFRDISGSYKGLFNSLSFLCYLVFIFWLIELLISRIKIKQKLMNSDLPDCKI